MRGKSFKILISLRLLNQFHSRPRTGDLGFVAKLSTEAAKRFFNTESDLSPQDQAALEPEFRKEGQLLLAEART